MANDASVESASALPQAPHYGTTDHNMINKEAPAGTQSVLRAVALLKALAAAEHEMDLGELTDAVDLARTTAHRLLSALESEQLVARNPETGAYRLGPAAIVLGARALRSNDLPATVRPFLSELAETSKETATLEVLSDDKMLILDEVAGSYLLAATPELGTLWPLHATATGKAMLAALPEAERSPLVAALLERFTARTITSKAKLERELERIRERGYATAVEELEAGFVAVAAVVRGGGASPVAAVSLNAPATRLRGQKLRRATHLVVRCARRASTALGHED